MTNFHYKNTSENFIDINKLKSVDNIKEIELINFTLNKLHNTMCRYMHDMKTIWNDQIVDFMKSQDCFVLDKLAYHESDKFIDFMMSQETYKSMQIAKDRLLKRRYFLKNAR
jgi:hypothetical protein